MSIPRCTVRIASGDHVPQMTVTIATPGDLVRSVRYAWLRAASDRR